MTNHKGKTLRWRTWFVRYAPVEWLYEKATFDKKRTKYLWFDSLKNNIAEKGLANPILLFTGTKKSPLLRLCPGGNRLIAVRELGWQYIPTLVVGETLPANLEGIELKTMEEVRTYIPDGRFVCLPNIVSIRGVKKPETREYPEAKVRYFDKEE